MRKALKRAVSPLIATMILMVICIVIGLMLYSMFASASSALFAKAQVSVEAVDLVRQADGRATFSIVIKNTGNKPAVWLTAWLRGEGEQELEVNGDYVSDTNPLQPGQCAALVIERTTTSFTVGYTYRVIIRATFSDGSMFARIILVTCR